MKVGCLRHERTAATRPNVDLAVVANAGHNVPTNAPGAFGAVVNRWVHDVELPRA